MRKNRLAVLLAAAVISTCIPETVLFVGSPIEVQATADALTVRAGIGTIKIKAGWGATITTAAAMRLISIQAAYVLTAEEPPAPTYPILLEVQRILPEVRLIRQGLL